ncbi:hypothetical protein CKO22_17415, partial [Thiococcus pfennigii]|nr:hypothetical protein [Thiococcus pfennigii]
FPLLIGGAMAGVATFYAPEPDFFARDVVELLDEMSRDLAFSLDRFAQEAARVLAEQGLRVRERQLAAIFRAAPVGIGLIKHRQILQVNDYFAELLGYRQDEIIGQGTRRFYADEVEYERVGRALYAGITAHESLSVEARLRRRDGEVICVQASVASLDSAAHPGVMVFTVLDITERHRQEEALQRSGWRLEQAERLANVGAWEIDVAARRLTPSAQWRRIHGTDAEDLGLDALIETHAHPEDRPALERAMQQVLAGEGRYDLEHRIVRADDGQVRTIHAIGEAARDPDGRPIRVYGAALDITERRRAEEERLARERELAAIFRAAPIGIGLTRARRILRVNDYLARLLGYEPAELIGQDARLVYPSDEEYERVGREKYRQLAATGFGTVETRWLARDGRQLDVLLSSSLVDAADPTGAAVFTALDITERKRAEAALQASEERLRLVMAATNDALVDWDVGSGRLTVNDRFFELLGFDPGGFAPTFEWILARVHPEDRARLLRELEAGMAGDEPFAVEGRIRPRTGDWLWVQSRGQVVARDGGARPVRVAGTMTDVTASRRAEAALRESHRRLTEAERLAQLGHWECDLASGQPVWSEQVYRIFGLDPDRPPPPPVGEHGRLFHADDVDEYQRVMARTRETGEPFAFVLRVWRSDGALRWLSATGHLERTADGCPRRLFGTAQDVTEQHDAAERLRQAAQVFESTGDGVIITDAAERILAVNRAFTEITGYTETELLGETPRALKSGRHDRAFYQAMWASLRRTGSWRGEIWNRRKGGEIYPELLTISAVPGHDGGVSHYVAVFSDLTSLKRSEEQLEHLAHHDPLTELPNRALFRTRLAHGLQRAERDRRRLGVLVMDLDRFKVINDSMGPASGDEALRQIGASLTEALRPGDTLARLGGDEFGLILEDLGDPSVAVATAQRLMAICARPRQLGGREVAITACVGIGLYPGDGDDGDSLLRHADVALSQAKEAGPQTLQFFEPAMERSVVERLHLEGCLRQALAAGELRLHYQPQVRLADGSLIGAEALLRWRSAELGEVPPGRFIPLAEEIGLIDEIGAWVLRQGCEQLRAWDAAGLHLPRLAINLSIRQLEAGDLIERCDRTFRETGVAPERIELEVTESMVMRRADLSVEVLNGLRDLGVRLVIDDFGTGYSSLAYLRRLPLHQLKIDKSFVDDLLDDPNSQAIARAIIALGHSLGLEVLAEGVEEADQAQRLRLDGCDLAQGYHFARPLPVDEFAEHWLR